jgi:hypothetical protein
MIIEYVASAFLYSKELSERGLSQRLQEIYVHLNFILSKVSVHHLQYMS